MATQQLRLTPQEQALYQRHLENLYGSGKVVHPDGGISTLYQMSVEGPGKRHYNIPSVYDGHILHPTQAIQRAEQAGWHQFPSYPSGEEADARYQAMHGYFDQDMDRYHALQQKQRFSGR